MSQPAANSMRFEQQALGALLLADDPRGLIVAHGATAADFSDRGHAEIFAAIHHASGADPHGRAETVGVFDALLRAGQAEACGGLDYLHRLAGCVATDRNFGKDVGRMRKARLASTTADSMRQAAQRIDAGADLAEVLEGVLHTAGAAMESASARPLPFELLPVAGIEGAAPPAPSYWWQGLVPAGAVTLWSGHGSSAKSFIGGLMLAVSIASGRSLFGESTRAGTVAYFSGEDPAGVVLYRLHVICRSLGVDAAELEGRLHIIDGTVGDPVLYQDLQTAAGRMGATTRTYQALRDYIAAHGVQVLIVDNASDAFDGNEINRAPVRGFMRALRALVPDDGAAVLLAHVDKGTSRGDRGGVEAYSGSTAWHNSARSRIVQTRDKDGVLQLEHQKNNYGPLHAPIRLVWPAGGVPQLDEPMQGVVQHIADRNDTASLLKLIAEFSERGEFVSTATTSPTHAGKLLRGQPGFPARLPVREVFDLLRQAERRGWLARITVRSKGRGHEKEAWSVTPEGRKLAGLAPTAPTAPTPVVGAVADGAPTAPTSAPGGVGGVGARANGAGAAA